MAEVGVIALDPIRLGGLEVYLQGLGDGCRRRSRTVAEAFAGSGIGADGPVAELERLAVLCQQEADEVRWRRALVEALPDDLPLPPRQHDGPAAARAAAESLAEDVEAALAEEPPRWIPLVQLLAELDRNATSGPFAAAFLAAIGPQRARRLPLVLERAWEAWWEPPPGPDGRPGDRDPTAAEAGVVRAMQDRLAEVVKVASQVTGDHALGEMWCRSYAGLPATDDALAVIEGEVSEVQRRTAEDVERSLRTAGYGLGVAGAVARAVGWRRAAAALTVDRGLLGLVTAPMSLLDGDGVVCDGSEALLGTAAAGLTVLGAVVPVVAGPAAVAGGVLSGLAVIFNACERQEPRLSETRPTVDPATGQSRLPSGHQTNPHVDEAGVPLPPSYGMDGER